MLSEGGFSHKRLAVHCWRRSALGSPVAVPVSRLIARATLIWKILDHD